MKKNSFIEGSIIATLSIVLIKILGMLYVIPFYKIVGQDGGALYSYGYNIYLIFLSISSAGIPNAISKVISEYSVLDYKEAQHRATKIAKMIVTIISVVAFAILFIFAEEIGKFIIHDLNGNNTYQDVAFIVRCVAPAVLIIPILSVDKGFLQGHKYIKPSSMSELIEQVVRIVVILCGSYLCLKTFNGTLRTAIGISVSGAFFGGLAAIIYIKIVKNKNDELKEIVSDTKDSISNKKIIKEIIRYAIPFVILSIVLHVYNFTDQILILRTLENLNYSASDVEFIASAISTWASKICTIITAVATGITTSLIPTVVAFYAKNDKKEVESHINKALSLVFSASLPMVLGISILAKPVWHLFYNDNKFGWMILGFTVFSSLLYNTYLILTSILQSLNKFKAVYMVSIIGFVTNAILDVPLMKLFYSLGFEAFYGAITSTLIGYSLSLLIGLLYLKKKEKIEFKETGKIILKDLVPSIAMVLVLILLNNVIVVNELSTIGALERIIMDIIVGGIVYIFIAYKLRIIDDLLGDNAINRIIGRIKRKFVK